MPAKKSSRTKAVDAEVSFTQKDIDDNKTIASLSYIFILCLVPLILKQKSPYAQFHAKQGLTITVAWFIIWIIGIIPLLGWLISFVGTIALLVVSIVGILKTLNGEAWKIPYIYEYSKKWNL